jgi:hypothetical protein
MSGSMPIALRRLDSPIVPLPTVVSRSIRNGQCSAPSFVLAANWSRNRGTRTSIDGSAGDGQ